MNHALKSQLKAGLIALCLALMPTTLCYSQATVPVAGLTAAQALPPAGQSARRQFRQTMSSLHSAISIQAASCTWVTGMRYGKMKTLSGTRMEPTIASRRAGMRTTKPTEKR